ncbi:MAG: Do family serine endopeptidase [Flavobacteriales bacterium]|nr:Do family serine endopeptidase [Flavobacteriales bacterium]
MKKLIKPTLALVGLLTLSGILSISFYKALAKEEKVKIIEKTLPPQPLLTSNKAVAGFANLEYAAEMSINSVVHIKTKTEVRRQTDPLLEFFYGRPQQLSPREVQASGSGVIISNDGYIVTNNHVVEGANEIEIVLNNKKSFTAELIGSDPNTDIALLKIESNDLPHIQYGNSNNLKIGEWVLAVGNPFNLTSTVTAGIVSAKGRDINILKNDPYTGISAIESFIQTDAAVNPGNSGGALVNTNGELIGINTAIQSNTGSYTGYSFAIPVNIVKKVVSDLKEFGTVQRAFIGVSIANIDEELAKKLEVSDLSGVYVNDVTKNGSAAKAGIKNGDIIKKIGNKTISDVPELQEQIGQFRPGDKISITLLRENKEIEISLTLKNLNGDEGIINSTENEIFKKLGVQLVELSQKELKKLDLDNGVKIIQLYNGKLRSIGINEGFIITKINHQKVSTVKDVYDALSNIKGGVLMEGLYENGRKEYYGFGL